jgi:hypothetical protein
MDFLDEQIQVEVEVSALIGSAQADGDNQREGST